MRIVDVPAHDNLRRKRVYGDMASVGSRTIRMSQEYLRKAGAAARIMLVEAAAQRIGVETAHSSGRGFPASGPTHASRQALHRHRVLASVLSGDQQRAGATVNL